MVEHANVHLGVSHLKRKLIAPQSFSKIPNLHSHDYMARYQVLATLRKELSLQNEEVIASVPAEMKKFTELTTQRTTSLVIAQRDLGMVRDDDNNLAEKALNEASYAAGKEDATQGLLAELTDKETGLIKQNQELKAELQKLVLLTIIYKETLSHSQNPL